MNHKLNIKRELRLPGKARKMEKFGETLSCPKCNAPRLANLVGEGLNAFTLKHRGASGMEWIDVSCSRCGYTFREQCSDAPETDKRETSNFYPQSMFMHTFIRAAKGGSFFSSTDARKAFSVAQPDQKFSAASWFNVTTALRKAGKIEIHEQGKGRSPTLYKRVV